MGLLQCMKHTGLRAARRIEQAPPRWRHAVSTATPARR